LVVSKLLRIAEWLLVSTVLLVIESQIEMSGKITQSSKRLDTTLPHGLALAIVCNCKMGMSRNYWCCFAAKSKPG
jgi:hypothetical protein